MNRKEFLKTGMLAAAASALMSWIPKHMVSVSESKQNTPWIPKRGYTIAELNAKVEEYYGDPDDVSAVGRARKMQALINGGCHQGEDSKSELSDYSARHFAICPYRWRCK